MRRFAQFSIALAVVIGLAGVTLVPQTASAQEPLGACDINESSALCATEKRSNNEGDGYSYVVKNVVNILLYIVGAAAVIVIIISGIRYVVSGGNSNQVQAAKLSLIYAVVGLLVAIIAYSIVNYVLIWMF